MYDYIKKLNPEQREAATTIEGPLRIVAGAGSGKTATLIARVAYMVDEGIDPNSILLLTFTNAAANEMMRRACSLSNPACASVTACTFHSFCAAILRKYGPAGVRNSSIITGGECVDAVRLVRSSLGYTKKAGFPNDKKTLSAISASANNAVPLEGVLDALENSDSDFYEYRSEILKIANEYRSYKESRGLLDYDDLLIKVDELLRTSPKVAETVQDRFRYVMVDEYQDTNVVQERIVFNLTRKHRNLAVVGDDYQSIYRFRYANVENILKFPEKTRCKSVVLKTNYRSTPEVVALSNALMDRHADFGVKKTMVSARSFSGGVPTLEIFEDQAAEAAEIFSRIQADISAGVPPKEIAVLGRNGDSSFKLEALFNQNRVPFVKRGGAKFFEREAILDMLAYARAAANPSDELAWFRIFDVVPGVGDAYAQKITEDLSTEIFLDIPWALGKQFYRDVVSLKPFMARLRAMLNNPRGFFSLVESLYCSFRQRKIDNGQFSDEGRRTVAQEQFDKDRVLIGDLMDIAERYATVPEFLDAVVLDAESPKEGDDVVVVSTVHSAKGLEWSRVYLLDVIDGVYPPHRGDLLEDEESLRLLYVAMTRAKDSLMVGIPKRIVRSRDETGPSPFLNGLEDVLKTTVSKQKGTAPAEKVYLQVPYEEKDEAKSYGARWDPQRRSWYALVVPGEENSNARELLRRWSLQSHKESRKESHKERWEQMWERDDWC